jgi:hypothetical protein
MMKPKLVRKVIFIRSDFCKRLRLAARVQGIREEICGGQVLEIYLAGIDVKTLAAFSPIPSTQGRGRLARRLSATDRHKIRELVESGELTKGGAAERYRVGISTICRALKGA